MLSDIKILTSNASCCVCIDTQEFGQVLFVVVGATDVETVDTHAECQAGGQKVRKGHEIGIFQFGGSSIVEAFERGMIAFDKDLLGLGKQCIMVGVEVGGRA